MKNKLLLLLLLAGFAVKAQPCITPPPPGMNPIFAFDPDNDGIAVFDIGYYIENILKPNLEQVYGVSPDGYDFVFQGPDGPIEPAPMYTNIELDEIREIQFVYSGSGPTFNPLPPCFWPVFFFDTVILYAVPTDGDFDNDGILNLAEDTNSNGNLMDDDDDNDGIINILDTTNSLNLPEAASYNFKVYPNPVTNGEISFESDIEISSVTVYDSLGREIKTDEITGNSIRFDGLASGTYLVRFQSEGGSITKRIAVE